MIPENPGPQRSGPTIKGGHSGSPQPDTTRSGGTAYSPPPSAPSAGSGQKGGGKKSPLLPIAAAVMAVVLGFGAWSMMPANDEPPPAPITQVQSAKMLQLSSADIDWEATRLAIAMIKSGKVPPPAPAVAASNTFASPGTSSTQPTNTTAPAQAGMTITTAQANVIPPIHRVKRVRTVAAQPAAAVAPAVADTPAPAPDPSSATPAADDTSAAPAELQAAVADLLAHTSAEARQEIVEGKTMIYKVHVLDNVFEDGDQVEIFVNGQSRGQVNLTNAGSDIDLAFTPGTTVEFKSVASRDGGGGVTFGARSASGETRSRVMNVGESDIWQVTVK